MAAASSPPDYTYWLPVVSALIAVGGTLGGTIVAVRLKSGDDQAQWRRARRQDLYADFASCAGDALIGFTRYFSATHAERDDRRAAADQLLFDMDRSSTRVQLIAPAEVRSAVLELMDCVATDVWPRTGHRTEVAREQAEALVAGYLRLYEQFMAAARASLGADADSREVIRAHGDRSRLVGLLGIVFASLGVAADLLLQYTPDAGLLGPLHLDALLTSVPVWRIWAGGLLGLFAFVLAGTGVWYASLGIAGSARLARVFLISGLISGLLGYAWGAAFHVTFLLRGLVDHAADLGTAVGHAGPLLDTIQQAQYAVLAGSAVALVCASICFSWAVASGRTAYPRLVAALNPVVIYVVLTAAAYSIPVADIVLAPTTFSLMSVVFFSSGVVLGSSPASQRAQRVQEQQATAAV